MLKQRIITALLLLPLVFVLLFAVPLDFFVTGVMIITYLLGLEWGRLAGFSHPVHCSLYALFISVINLLLWGTAGNFRFWPSLSWPSQIEFDLPMVVLLLALAVITLSAIIVFTFYQSNRWWANKPVRSLFGGILLPAFFVSLVSIRSVGSVADFYHGGQLVLMMFCIIWAADTGAFITGKLIGKHKLAPIVSPNKTWEGAIGGIIFSFIIAWAGAWLLRMEIQQPVVYSLAAVFIAGLSVIGDLFESALKRVANIKDSGNLLPGHGGVLDRLDSSIVVAPVFFLVYSYFGWF